MRFIERCAARARLLLLECGQKTQDSYLKMSDWTGLGVFITAAGKRLNQLANWFSLTEHWPAKC